MAEDKPKFAKGDLTAVMNAYPHVKKYVEDWEQNGGTRPIYYGALDRNAKDQDNLNLIYITKEPIFVHAYQPIEESGTKGRIIWLALEPSLSVKDGEVDKRRKLVEILLREAPNNSSFSGEGAFELLLRRMVDEHTILDSELGGKALRKGFLWEILGLDDKRIVVSEDLRERLKYIIVRDLIKNGPLEPLLSDEMLEDIHCIGLHDINMDHKVFKSVTSNIKFRDRELLTRYLRSMSERIGRPVSDNKPIQDGSLLDGSRINIIFSDDVSIGREGKGGPSFTIRKFAEETISITQLIDWGTMSAEVAAYIWMCLEYGMSVLVSGETASGKTTTLNAILPFIDHNVKIYSAEDTPEVKVKHKIWQRLVTREAKSEESSVTMFGLLKAALRSRPRYIIIGEIRGVEGATAFQAMQTGHPVIATFHASSIVKMIQRFTGDPINVPIRFFDNLNFAIFQEVVELNGSVARRITGVDEVIGYNKHSDGVLTRGMFEWSPLNDKHYFRGMFQSHLLENKISALAGFENKREVYEEIDRRKEALQTMVDRRIIHYDDVFNLLTIYYNSRGEEGGWDLFREQVDKWTPK